MHFLRGFIPSKRAVLAGIGAIWMAAALSGCQTPPAPATGADQASAQSPKAAANSSVQSGRSIFTHQCIACHGVQPVRKYSAEKWREIVGKMAPRAKLSSSQERDLLAYISAARQGAD